MDEKTVFTSAKVLAFLDEYEALCRKHGCIVLSEGEEVEAVEVDSIEGMWGIRESTEYRADYKAKGPRYHRRHGEFS